MPFRLIRDLFKTRSKAGSAAGASAVTADDASYRGSSEAWLRQGEALEDADDITGALECYRACVRAYPGHLDARLALGNCLAAAWRTDECLAAFAEAVALAPNNSEVLSGLLLYAHYASSVDPRALF